MDNLLRTSWHIIFIPHQFASNWHVQKMHLLWRKKLILKRPKKAEKGRDGTLVKRDLSFRLSILFYNIDDYWYEIWPNCCYIRWNSNFVVDIFRVNFLIKTYNNNTLHKYFYSLPLLYFLISHFSVFQNKKCQETLFYETSHPIVAF